MKTRGTLLVVALVALLICVWRAAQRDALGPAESSATTSASPSGVSQLSASRSSPPASNADSAAVEGSSRAPIEAPTAPLVEDPALEVEPPSYEITVDFVRGDDGEPVAGAEVLWIPAAPRSGSWDNDSLVELVETTGERATADEHGKLTVRSSELMAWFAARKDGRWGCGIGFAGRVSHPAPIEMWRDADVSVLVVDTEGASVAGQWVELRLWRREPGDPGWESWRPWIGEAWVRSDANGLAKFRHAGADLQRLKHRPGRPNAQFLARPALRIAPDVVEGAPLDADALPEQPITLVLPSTGRLEVHVLDNEQPWDSGNECVYVCEATLFTNLDAEGFSESNARALEQSKTHRALSNVCREGRVVFDGIGLDADLIVATRRNGASIWAWARVVGPATRGAQVSTTLQLQRGVVTIDGRMLLPDGRPAAEEHIYFALGSFPLPTRERLEDAAVSNAAPVWSTSCIGDKTGRFRFDLPSSLARGGRPVLVLYDFESDPKFAATVDLEPHWSEGFHDLGDIALALPPVAARGRVVDELGAPLDGVLVYVSAPGGFARVRSRSRGDGTFEVRAPELGESIDVSAWSNGRMNVRFPREPRGRSDFEIVLPIAAPAVDKLHGSHK